MSVIVGLLAGRGIGEQVLGFYLANPHVDKIVIVDPVGGIQPFKLKRIPYWLGEDSHNSTGRNRENLRSYMRSYVTNETRYFLIGDDDGLPDPDYFDALTALRYSTHPQLLTGKLRNTDGTRWYDICSFNESHDPVLVPYDQAISGTLSGKLGQDLYANGNQHILNRAAWELNIPYPDIRGEDPHYSWAIRKAGAQLKFVPELKMTLIRQHPSISSELV